VQKCYTERRTIECIEAAFGLINKILEFFQQKALVYVEVSFNCEKPYAITVISRSRFDVYLNRLTKEANRRAATVRGATLLSEPLCGTGFVSDYVRGTQVPPTENSGDVEAVQVCLCSLLEGHRYSRSHLLDLEGHADRYKQSVRVSATHTPEFSEPAKVARLQ
jgi:hypothetical protein